MTKVNKLKMIRKTTLIAMAVAAVFATMPTQAKNMPDSQFAFSWDGNEVLVNNQFSGATENSFTKNDDGSFTFKLHNQKNENPETGANGLLGNYYHLDSVGRYKVSEKGINIKNSEFVGNSTSAKYVSSTIMLTAWGNIGMPALEHRFEGTTFKNNKTTVSGGAIAVIYESAGNVLSNLKINNSSFEGNHAGKSGGAISLDFYDVEISNTEFKGNSSVESGGAINSHAKKLVLNDVVFTDNKSEENGGAIVLRETKPAMNDGNGNYSNVHQTIEAALNVVNHDLTYTGNKVTGDQAKE